MMKTEVLPALTRSEYDEAISRGTIALRAGEVVAVPSETVYGLAAHALDPVAVAKIFAAKERPSFDPLIVHLSHRDEVEKVAEIPPEVAPTLEALMRTFWPGPLTIILPKKACVPDIVTSGLPTVAVRVPAHTVFRRLIRVTGLPLAAPSANRFGRISPTSASAVLKELDGRIPVIIDGGACAEGLESTIIRVSPPRDTTKPYIEVLRAGPVTKEKLQEFGRVKFIHKTVTTEAPGQMESHYAPRTPLRLLEPGASFTPEAGRRYALLSMNGAPKKLNLADFSQVAVLSPVAGKLSEASIRFFALLRQLDEAGVDEIIAEPVSEVGLGVAIMDRLRKAAAGHSAALAEKK
jgi:L-threonylcarbamoyladenylate synthase